MKACNRCADKRIQSDLMRYCLECMVTFILHERGLRPYSLDELRNHLREIKFDPSGLDLEWILQNYELG